MAERAVGSRPLVVGLGSDEGGDDRVGPEVCRALRAHGDLAADVQEGPGDLTRLFDLWSDRTFVVLVDAVRTGAAVGTVHRWDGAEAEHWPLGREVSTHGLSLAQVLHLGRGLGRVPPRITIFGVEIGDLALGTRLSPAVARAVPEVCRAIERELANAPSRNPRAEPEAFVDA